MREFYVYDHPTCQDLRCYWLRAKEAVDTRLLQYIHVRIIELLRSFRFSKL